MADYVKLAATAKRLIEKNGRPLSFLQQAGPGDPSKPWRGPSASPTSAEAIGVILDYELAQVDGQLIKRGDKQCFTIMPAGTTDPLQYDSVTDPLDSSTWNIERSEQLVPGSVILMYILQLRQ